MTKKVAVIGATGLVGKELIKILEQRIPSYSAIKLYPLASVDGRYCSYKSETIEIKSFDSFLDELPSMDFIFNTANNHTARIIDDILKRINGRPNSKLPIFIDSSSAFRKEPSVPLVIPEINKTAIQDSRIIASPNCSTSIVAMAINKLVRNYKIERITATTYQAASGGGKELLNKLMTQHNGIRFSSQESLKKLSKKYIVGRLNDERQYSMNVYTHESPICVKTKYSEEELKMNHELQKIFNTEIQVSATCVRVPTIKSHAVSLDIEFNHETYPSVSDAIELISSQQGVRIINDIRNSKFPEPILSDDLDEILVGRIRKDLYRDNQMSMFISGDQLRKGAALNAVQIMEAVL